MSISIITIGTVDHSVYASVAEADDYLAADIKRSVNWAALTTDEKNQSIVSATRYLDSFRWQGDPVDPVPVPQPNEFPRTGLVDKNGDPVTTTDAPPEVEDATILLAYEGSQNPAIFDSNSTSNNIKRVKAGSVEIENFRSESGTAFSLTFIFDLVGIWVRGGLDDAIFAFASGTDVLTSTGRLYERTKGFP